jgi:hypothetical protein
MKLSQWALAGCMLASATAAVAGERTATDAIVARNWSAAERTLVAERRIFPERPELMLNLAAVYIGTDRTDAARALYRQVLARPAVAMDMPSGAVVSSHDVARRGLDRLGAVKVLAAR